MAEEEDELLNEIAAQPHAASPAGQMILRMHRHLKKPTIEAPLAEEMLTYLNYLRESQVFLNNGIMNFSFAEGALLIQIAAQLYSRKVDLLWKSVIEYHEHMANYEEPTEDNAREMERIQERKNRYSRKKKVPEVLPEAAENLPQPLVLNGLQTLRQYPPQTSENQQLDEVQLPDQVPQEPEPIVQANEEAPVIVAEPTPEEEQEENNVNLPQPEDVAEVVPLDPEVQIKQEMQEYIDKAYSMCPKEVHANLFQNLASLVYDVIVLDDDTTVIVTSTPRKTVDSHSDVESGFFDHSDIESVVPNGDNRTTPITPMLFSPVPDEYYAEDRTTVDYPELAEEEQKNTSEEQIIELETSAQDDSGIFGDNNVTVEEVVSRACRKRTSIIPVFAEIKIPKRRKVLCKKSLTVNLKSFESFFSKTYQAESGEGDPPPFVDDSDSVSDSDIFVIIDDDDDGDDHNNIHEVREVTIKEESSDEAPALMECTDEQTIESEKNDDLECMKINFDLRIAELEKARVEQNKIMQEEARTAEEQAKKYREWSEFINEKIGEEQENDFDIHAEGSKIIESIGKVGDVKKFAELADGKSPRDVCCSFIAMLELVNKCNVELDGTNPGGLANDTLKLKLVSKDRHHESLLGYNAPSELSYRENLANVARSRFQFQHTRPLDLPSTSTGYQAKRPRY